VGELDELQSGDPRRIGPYWLEGRLGAGGIGRVYLGRTPEGGHVAITAVREELADNADFRARLAREVAAARKVSGVFTEPVVDADLDGPVPWLATVYVPGPSLADAVAVGGALSADSVLKLAAGLAEGLEAIHSAGILHGDLKPSNVILGEGGPRILGFGFSGSAELSVLTGGGWVAGLAGSISPEQAEGRDVGPPSDIFSLGAVLAFAAMGKDPFGDGTIAARLYRVVHGEPELGGLLEEFRPVIEWCLAKEPRHRPTIAQFLAGLDTAQPTCPPPGPAIRGHSAGPVIRSGTATVDLLGHPATERAAAAPHLPPGGASARKPTVTATGLHPAGAGNLPSHPPTRAVPPRPPDGAVRRYGPGVPAIPPGGQAGLTAERVWRSGHLPRPPRRPRRLARALGSALTVILLAASGVVLYIRFHHAPFQVTGAVITQQTRTGCRVDVTGRITTNGSAGTISYQWLFQPDRQPSQPLSQSVTAGQQAVYVTVAAEGTGQGSASRKVTLQVLGLQRRSAATSVVLKC
jgi:hypothetical protein